MLPFSPLWHYSAIEDTVNVATSCPRCGFCGSPLDWL